MTNYREWYDQHKPTYDSFLAVIKPLLETLVSNKGIHHWHIEGRVKQYDRFIGKIWRKKIDNPEEINDLLGLRIICFILSDVERVKEVIEKNFKVVQDMEDKAEALGTDKFGYRSVHYIASYNDLKFEIQIRTILAHAWAEIEHDRSYKSSFELPTELQREFFRLSADLESVDERFQQLVDRTEEYRNKVSKQAKEGKFEAKIDSVSIDGYMREKYGSENLQIPDKDVIEELKSRGITSLRDLDDMILKESKKYTAVAEITQEPFSRVAIADVYGSRDKKILRPKYLKSLSDLSHRYNTKCINEADVLKNTGLGGYLEGIIPYVVADLEQDGLIQRCEKRSEIGLTEKGRKEVNQQNRERKVPW